MRFSEDEAKQLEDQIQKLTDKYVAEVDKAVEEKIKRNFNSVTVKYSPNERVLFIGR